MQGYRLGDAQMQFDIDVEVTLRNASGNFTQQLILDPSTPTVRSGGGDVTAQLLGDLALYKQSPNFNYALLMIPTPLGAPPSL